MTNRLNNEIRAFLAKLYLPHDHDVPDASRLCFADVDVLTLDSGCGSKQAGPIWEF
jgi:hypothetical protein